MARVYAQRMRAELDGDFVVFLMGMRINKPWKLYSWLPLFLAMPIMLKELYQQLECSFLGHISSGVVLIQYWCSFEHLEAYACSQDHQHWPAWVAFNKSVRRSRGDVGIGTKRSVLPPASMRQCTAACQPLVGAKPERWFQWLVTVRKPVAAGAPSSSPASGGDTA